MISASKRASGTVTKWVSCAVCGQGYEYELKRTVFGKSSKEATTQAEAEAQAALDAEAQLKAKLETSCDLVGCPSCGAITEEMRTFRRKFFGAAFLGLGMGSGGFFALYLVWVFLHHILLWASVLSLLCFLLGAVLLVTGMVKVLIPRKGKLPGTGQQVLCTATTM